MNRLLMLSRRVRAFVVRDFEYIGINKHEGEDIGLFDTVLSSTDYQESIVIEHN